MTVATPEELDYTRAMAAHQHTSFIPDERAKSEQQNFANHVNGTYEKLLHIATSDAMRAVLDSEIAQYKEGYKQRLYNYLAARSNTASTMITGGSGFDVRRNQKKLDTAQRRLEELLEWQSKAFAAMQKRILAARTTDEVLEADWKPLERDLRGSLATIHTIDTTDSYYTRIAFVNSIVGKVARLAKQGNVELVNRAVALVQEYNATHKKPAIAARNTFWQLPQIAASKQAQQEVATQDPSMLFENGDIQVFDNPSIDRIQVFFPGKPSDAVRTLLKSAGWRWSNTNGAWQRQRTNNAIVSAKDIVQKAGM